MHNGTNVLLGLTGLEPICGRCLLEITLIAFTVREVGLLEIQQGFQTGERLRLKLIAFLAHFRSTWNIKHDGRRYGLVRGFWFCVSCNQSIRYALSRRGNGLGLPDLLEGFYSIRLPGLDNDALGIACRVCGQFFQKNLGDTYIIRDLKLHLRTLAWRQTAFATRRNNLNARRFIPCTRNGNFFIEFKTGRIDAFQ